MFGDEPDSAADVRVHAERLVVVRRLLEELSRREVLALAASIPMSNEFGWASLGPDSDLTEDQEDFVDYWTPERVLADCRAKRELVCALDEWGLTAESPSDQQLVYRLLELMVAGTD